MTAIEARETRIRLGTDLFLQAVDQIQSGLVKRGLWPRSSAELAAAPAGLYSISDVLDATKFALKMAGADKES